MKSLEMQRSNAAASRWRAAAAEAAHAFRLADTAFERAVFQLARRDAKRLEAAQRIAVGQLLRLAPRPRKRAPQRHPSTARDAGLAAVERTTIQGLGEPLDALGRRVECRRDRTLGRLAAIGRDLNARLIDTGMEMGPPCGDDTRAALNTRQLFAREDFEQRLLGIGTGAGRIRAGCRRRTHSLCADG